MFRIQVHICLIRSMSSKVSPPCYAFSLALSWDRFCSSWSVCSICRHFCLAQLRDRALHPSSRLEAKDTVSQYPEMPTTTLLSPQQRTVWPPTTIILMLRNPALELSLLQSRKSNPSRALLWRAHSALELAESAFESIPQKQHESARIITNKKVHFPVSGWNFPLL